MVYEELLLTGEEGLGPDAAAELEQRVQRIEEREAVVRKEAARLEGELQKCQEELQGLKKDRLQAELDLQKARDRAKGVPIPPGPQWLSFIGSPVFAGISITIVIVNVALMVVRLTQAHTQHLDAPAHLRCRDAKHAMLDCAVVASGPPQPQVDDHAVLFHMLDHIFLVWYVLELSGNLIYFQRGYLIGEVAVVGWNWLDLTIVACGIIEQWLFPLLLLFQGAHHESHGSMLGAMRALRLLRVLRFLKVLRAVLFEDVDWVESPIAEAGMSAVIATNSVVMALELDIPWAGWVWVENAFLVIYCFELIARIRHQGSNFFKGGELFWNISDLVMVLGGTVDLWVLPTYELIQATLGSGDTADSARSGENQRKDLLKLMRLMRIVRIVRLVRLLRTIKPLYRLLMGVIESLKAMQWVLLLTALMLYAFAIFWTSLVGHGLISGGEVTEESRENFGTVVRSLFALFQLMNGELDVAHSITDTIVGQLLIAAFLVVANWAILAILTAVVSDNMIDRSKKSQEEDELLERQTRLDEKMKRLRGVFTAFGDSDGVLSEEERERLLADGHYAGELCEITNWSLDDLRDTFQVLSVEAGDPPKKEMRVDDFFSHLNDGSEVASKRAIVQLMAGMRDMEKDLTKRLGVMERGMGELLVWRKECRNARG